MTEPADFVYTNAPLIEVVAELRWNLVPLASMPGAGVDPLFARASQKFSDEVRQSGFSHIERLVPAEVPIEVVAYTPILRHRRQAGKWPLFQIGPGLFSANITPPYDGWADFRRVLRAGLEALDRSFGLGSPLFEPNMVQLRYINGITAELGMVNYAEFCAVDLNLNVALPKDVAASMMVDPDKYVFAAEYSFAIARMDESSMTIKCSPGQANGIPVAILEIIVTRKGDLQFAKSVDRALAWMDEAHHSVHNAFQLMTSSRLKDAMGPTKQTGRM